MEIIDADSDIELVKKREFNVSCCRSYLTPKGRCFTCPEQDLEGDPDDERW
ncbi:MAG: hypothetical protein Q8R37_00180 [Nanoarchaeota archaeon]|nr:hypothetical protein [Nanoarchaeota archaeon]